MNVQLMQPKLFKSWDDFQSFFDFNNHALCRFIWMAESELACRRIVKVRVCADIAAVFRLFQVKGV